MLNLRGVCLVVMAIPLFLSVTLVLFLNIEVLSRDVKAASVHISDASPYIESVVRMQQALDAVYNDLRSAQEPALDARGSRYSSFAPGVLLDCRQLSAVQQLGSSTSRDPITRNHGLYGFKQVRIVEVQRQNCGISNTSHFCTMFANYQVLKEAMMYLQLSHSNLARLVGLCSPIGLGDSASYMVEAGPTVNLTNLKTYSLEKRLLMLADLLSFIEHLQNSSLGALAVRSLDRRTLVQIGDCIKLAEVSFITQDKKSCVTHNDCLLDDTNTGVKCHSGICQGFYAQTSVHKLMHFLHPLLADYQQHHKAFELQRLFSRMSHLDISLSDAVSQLQQLLGLRQAHTTTPASSSQSAVPGRGAFPGEYSDQLDWIADNLVWPGGPDDYKFERHENADITNGQHDYMCPRSLVSWGCQLQVSTMTQALTRCTGDPQCRAFVLTAHSRQTGTLRVTLKSGVDLEEKEGSRVYVKIPQAEQQLDSGQPVDLDTSHLTSCLSASQLSSLPERLRREKELFSLLNMKGITEERWQESVVRSLVTGVTLLKDRAMASGLQVQVHMDTGQIKSAILTNSPRHSQSHLAQLAFHHLDRILGLYITLPVAVRTFSQKELHLMAQLEPQVQNSLNAVLQANTTLQAILTVALPGGMVLNTEALSVQPLSTFPDKLSLLSVSQKRQLEYLTLLWLTGTPRQDKFTTYKGHAMHGWSMDSFQQGVDSVLPYFNSCHFPHSVWEVLHTLAGHTSCTLSKQLLYSLKRDGVRSSDISRNFQSIQQLTTLVDKAAERLLQAITTCIEMFGKENVLY